MFPSCGLQWREEHLSVPSPRLQVLPPWAQAAVSQVGGRSLADCLLEIHRDESIYKDRWSPTAYEFHYYLRYE